MDWKKIAKALLFPPFAILVVLLPVATVLLVGSMVFIGTETPVAYLAYALSAYTLTVWCARAPALVAYCKSLRRENRYLKKWFEDVRLRMNVTLYGSFYGNVAYGLFQLWLGFYHRTFWYGSFGVYYLCLALMRLSLVRYSSRHAAGEDPAREWHKYRVCGWIFLVMNLALSLIVFFMLYWNRTFTHHMITAIAMAAYTFASFTAAIVHLVQYRRYNSPVYSAAKAISFAAACVSMLTLTSTMLTTFSDGTMEPMAQKLMLAGAGVAVLGTLVSMAVYMIVKGTKNKRTEVQNGTELQG